jgi:hypothetical protein
MLEREIGKTVKTKHMKNSEQKKDREFEKYQRFEEFAEIEDAMLRFRLSNLCYADAPKRMRKNKKSWEK